MTTPTTMVQITMDELVEFRSYKAKLGVLKTEYTKLQAQNRELEAQNRSSATAATSPTITRNVSAMLANVGATDDTATVSNATTSASLSLQVESLTRQLQQVMHEKKVLQSANDELTARMESSAIEDMLKKAADEIEDLKRRLAYANRDRAALAEQAEAKAAEAHAAAVAVPAATVTPMMMDDIWENQRYVPLKGWVAAFLPTDLPHWSDESGKKKMPSKEEFALPSHGQWSWNDVWSVNTPTATDVDGWLYSRFSIFASWRPKQSLGDGVRRRRWQRTRSSSNLSNMSATKTPT